MPIQSSGAISIRDIQLVHNSASPTWQRVSFEDYYRTVGYVQDLPANSEVPETQGDPISFDDFYGTESPSLVEYELIGGGGGGGSGMNNGQTTVGVTDGETGGDSSIVIEHTDDNDVVTTILSVTSSGAEGGIASSVDRGSSVRTGDASYYGSGGAGGGLKSNGGNAPGTSYGAGGGGGGGRVQTNSYGGIYNTDPAGEGGDAAIREVSSENYAIEIPNGSIMTIVVGAPGLGGVDGGTNGGNGAGGYVKITVNSNEYIYSAEGEYTVTL